MEPLHLAQIAWAFSRFCYRGDEFGLLDLLVEETRLRWEEFPSQSLLDVHDALIFFKLAPPAPNRLETQAEKICYRLREITFPFAQCVRGHDLQTSVDAEIYRSK